MKKYIFVVIAFLLFLIGIGLAVILYDDAYPTTLLYFHDNNAYTVFTDQPLVKGAFIKGQVTAVSDNFGVLKLKTTTFNRRNDNQIVFQMREKGTSEWIVSNTYATDRFVNGSFYPFGFPVIENSKGKTYEFEIYSETGTTDNAIGFEKEYHAIATNYIFQKSDLLRSRGTAATFIKEKIFNLLSTPEFNFFAFIFIVPLFYYVCVIRIKNRKIVRTIGITCILYMLFTYMYIPISMNSNTIFYVFFATLGIAYYLKSMSSSAFIVGLLFLLQIPMMIYFGNEIEANRAATLVYFSMLAGILLV